jgi:hypothetical protein
MVSVQRPRDHGRLCDDRHFLLAAPPATGQDHCALTDCMPAKVTSTPVSG